MAPKHKSCEPAKRVVRLWSGCSTRRHSLSPVPWRWLAAGWPENAQLARRTSRATDGSHSARILLILCGHSKPTATDLNTFRTKSLRMKKVRASMLCFCRAVLALTGGKRGRGSAVHCGYLWTRSVRVPCLQEGEDEGKQVNVNAS